MPANSSDSPRRSALSRRRVLQLGLATGAGVALNPDLTASAAPAGAQAKKPTQTGGTGAPRAPAALTVDGLLAPLGVGLSDVFFAWQVDDPRRGAVQSAYRLVVSRPTIAGPLAGRSAVVWDSGRVPSAAQAFIPYGGPALEPDTTYSWTVQTWDGVGNPAPTSAPGAFDTGLADGDWQADWIKRLTVEPPPNNATTFKVQDEFGVWMDEDEFSYVRHEAVLGPSPIIRARVYVSADQLYELYVNGTMVGKGLAYQYPDSQYYETWDVTSVLRSGEANAFGILYNWQGPAKGHPAGTPGVIARISVLHKDGTTEAITTDGSWRVLPGAWLPGIQRDEEGDPVDYTENIDGLAIPVGWDQPGYDDLAWAPATVLGSHPAAPWTHLVSVRTRMVFEPVHAKSVTRLSNGAVVADFGKIYAALPQVSFRHGLPGRLINMHVGDLLDPSGQVSITHGTQHTNMSYSYIQRGGTETFRPFDYLGFRYLQIDEPGEVLTPADIVALTKHVAVPDEHAGTFSSSDPTVDAVFELGRHSALFTMQEQFVDTPTREKGPWLWDGHSESMTALVAFGDQNQTRKSLVEFAESQARYWPNGPVNKIYPTALGAQQMAYFTAIYVEWVWNYWLHTCDFPLLESLYPIVANVSGFVASAIASSGLVTDIPTATDVSLYPVDTTMNLLAINVFRRVAAIAAALGRPAGEMELQRRRQTRLVTSVNQYLSRHDGLYADGLDSAGAQIPSSSQWNNAYALLFNVVPAARVPRVIDYVISQGMATEPVFAGDMLEVLRVKEQDQAILHLLTDPSEPGWANILAQGGTFTWEVWDPTDTDIPIDPVASFFAGNSKSHGWGSNVLVSIQRALLGVVPTAPGFRTFTVIPPLSALDYAAGQVPTPAGAILVSWARSTSGFAMDVTVPANTSAFVAVPGSSPGAVTEGGAPASRAPGVRQIACLGDYVVIAVGAGEYSFRAT
ncbi:MAG TPA: family 78 glycoside hydrolase catalytic domain [Acidimicrobiales bacterium]|nr:family 78 glycoside hydrolase catalytic domain [Acidimicrobiales bacterium]